MRNIKFFYLALTLSFFISSNLFSQDYEWFPINSGTTQNLNFITTNYICGNNGILFHRSSYYDTIGTQVLTGISNNLFYYANLPSGQFITGSNGLIMKATSNTSFEILNTGVTNSINSIIRIGFGGVKDIAVGSDGLILHSVNNGLNWTVKTSGVPDNLNHIILRGRNLWICGDNGKILKSTNSSTSWNVLNTGTTNNIKSIYFSDTLKGFAVGSTGLFIKTTDGGTSWSGINLSTNVNLNNIIFSGDMGYISGDNGSIYRTTDLGNTWTKEICNSNQNITGVLLQNSYPNKYYAIGHNGTLLFRRVAYLYNPIREFQPNNIKTFIKSSGIFNQNTEYQNQPGFEWPAGSGKFLLFTSGLTIAAKVNNELRMAAASYKGEYMPGYVNSSGEFVTNDSMKIYVVSKTDNPNNNPDWMNWGLMVPFGAPFIDVNNNFQYEPFIDTPGVRGASQTIFCVMTDANPQSHDMGEGFGGGTTPLKAELRMTAWGYNTDPFRDVVFYKWDIINKSSFAWDSTFFMIYNDPDLGGGDDDYIGCDTVRDLTYCYNADNNDKDYGIAPPAVGTMYLQTPENLGMISSNHIGWWQGIPCETDPNGEPKGAYNFIKGYKKDLTPWVLPQTNPPQTTKFTYSGDPETNQGWTEFKGRIENCGGNLTGFVININPSGERKQMHSTGSDNLSIQPNQKVTLSIAQLVARGTSNLNSVTKLKEYADQIRNFYATIPVDDISGRVPNSFELFQNYPNPFNPSTTIRFNLPRAEFVKLRVFDVTGREIAVLLNRQMDLGSYKLEWNASRFSSGVYFYKLETPNFTDTKKMVLLK